MEVDVVDSLESGRANGKYVGGKRIVIALDAANKAYVDAAVAGGGGGGGGGMGGSFVILDDDNGNISLIFTPSVLVLADDNNGNISLTIV